MFFKQVKSVGDNFSYIIGDDTAKEAAVVDPSFNAEAIIQLVKENELRIVYVVDTHHHRDHTAGNDRIKSYSSAKIVAYRFSAVAKDVGVDDGDEVRVGGIRIKVIHTPGHTSDGICLLLDKKLLTGDTLFVGECGRTDLEDSSPREMYNSLFRKLAKLDEDVEVWPGHDYGPRPHSTIGEEKRTNYVLENRSEEEFLEFMKT